MRDSGGASRELEQGREWYARRAWADAHRSLSLADQAAPLAGDDLERLATSAYMIGRDDDSLTTLGRAHEAYLDAGEEARAARCAFWLGLRLLMRGEMGPATGWLARAQRLLEGQERDCVERGYLLLPAAEQQLETGDFSAAYSAAGTAAEIGERFKERDLIACARHQQGRALLGQGQMEAGLALLDEAMVAVTAGELSPLVTGLIYCSVIDSCQQVYAAGRAREWTSALTQWCAQQPQMVAFSGLCLVHRAEILQLRGDWRDAIEAARDACARFSPGIAAAAFYQLGEMHRLRGDFTAAEEAYRGASQRGLEPQPGLALLRLAQGRTDAAAAAIRRVLGATTDRLRRSRLLPAHTEILLASGDIEAARGASRELEEVAASFDTEVIGALAAHARGAVELAEGDAQTALGSLRHAWRVWQRIEAPYLAARVRVLLGLACRALGDADGADLELEAARAAFARLGAAPDVARLDALTRGAPAHPPHGLTRRELQVLRLVASGMTNKAIAGELFLSEKTIDRHVSNIFSKLDVPSRAAATAYAYEHRLL